MDKCPRYLKQWVLRCPPKKREKEMNKIAPALYQMFPSIYCFKYLGHLSIFSQLPLFFSFLSLFFVYMNNFCIAHASFPQQNFERQQQELGAFIWWMGNLTSMFLCSPSVQEQNIFCGSRWETCFCVYPYVGIVGVYVGDVYVILILRA